MWANCSRSEFHIQWLSLRLCKVRQCSNSCCWAFGSLCWLWINLWIITWASNFNFLRVHFDWCSLRFLRLIAHPYYVILSKFKPAVLNALCLNFLWERRIYCSQVIYRVKRIISATSLSTAFSCLLKSRLVVTTHFLGRYLVTYWCWLQVSQRLSPVKRSVSSQLTLSVQGLILVMDKTSSLAAVLRPSGTIDSQAKVWWILLRILDFRQTSIPSQLAIASTSWSVI